MFEFQLDKLHNDSEHQKRLFSWREKNFWQFFQKKFLLGEEKGRTSFYIFAGIKHDFLIHTITDTLKMRLKLNLFVESFLNEELLWLFAIIIVIIIIIEWNWFTNTVLLMMKVLILFFGLHFLSQGWLSIQFELELFENFSHWRFDVTFIHKFF